VEDIWHASQESHANTFACTMHASQESKREPRTSDAIMIFFEKNLQKKIGYLNSSWENIQFQKKNRPKRSPESEVMIILKSTQFQRFSENSRTVFKISSKIYLDMCGNINDTYTSLYPCRHLHLQQNLQRAQTCTVVRSSWSEGHGCLATTFCSLSFFIL
jgi:hypothetical protein